MTAMTMMAMTMMMMMMMAMTMMMMTTQVNEGVDGSNPLTQPVLPPSCLNPLADGDGDDDQDVGNDDDHDEDIEDCDHYGEHDDMMLITVWMLITVTIM